jgi:hypothetical protein
VFNLFSRTSVIFFCLALSDPAFSYSFQTHEQLIDLVWTDTIKPLLKHRFPNLSEADLVRAHGYAYGGSAIQDLGYYPFGNQFFSNLTHYVRSGDFVQSLFVMLERPTNWPSPSVRFRITSAMRWVTPTQ